MKKYLFFAGCILFATTCVARHIDEKYPDQNLTMKCIILIKDNVND